MKISTKGRYGLRALADLAINSDGTPVSILSIAQRQNISDNYLENMFSTLKKADFIRSIKGGGGGYVLTKKPSDIYIGEVLRALEGDLSIIDSSVSQEDIDTKSLKYCIEKNVWDLVSGKINDVVNSMTLQNMIENNGKFEE